MVVVVVVVVVVVEELETGRRMQRGRDVWLILWLIFRLWRV